MASKEEVAAWQTRLEDNFSYNDVVGGQVLPTIMEMEAGVGQHYVHSYKGHRVLTDAFLDFFAITLKLLCAIINKHGWPSNAPHFSECLGAMLALFRGMRAAEIVATNGYPLDGYALLRNVKDQALCIGAIASGLSSFPTWYGYKGMDLSAPLDREKNRQVVKNRKAEEFRIRNIMLGQDSGFGAEDLYELQRWENLFNMQVHGSRFSMMSDFFLMQKSVFAIGPLPAEDNVAMYMNRFSEISWMVHRVFWYLQHPDVRFEAEWERRWNIMDDSIRYMVLGLDELGKKIAKSFEAMIDAKFLFGPGTCYEDRE